MRYLIIGAGPSGLAVARSLQRASIEYDHVEADTALGGNWFHGVYSNLYTDACKDVMQFPDFPMPKDYPDFLSQPRMLSYLNHYADHFNIRKNIRFNTKAIWIEAINKNFWKVFFEDAPDKIYKGIIICNGHHWNLKLPELNGTFSGEYFHSKLYKTPDQLQNKRVLVIGSGNSAADIACEAARVGCLSVMSMRDSPWIFPKSFMGIPLGRMRLRNAPKFLDPILVRLLIKLSFGKHVHYNLANPKHKPFEKHPTVSEELPYYLKHGRIQVKPQITKIENKLVFFDDNTSMEFDLIVAATGFNLSFPFLPEQLIRTQGQNLRCIGHCVYPDYKGLFFVGWQQVRGGIGSLAAAFSNVIVDLIKLEETFDLSAGEILKSLGNQISESNLYGSKEIFQWIERNKYPALLKRARKLRTTSPHENKPTGHTIPSNISYIKVY